MAAQSFPPDPESFMSSRKNANLWAALFRISFDNGQTLQAQIRRALVTAVLDRQIPANIPLPSCRTLADRLGVARGTVVLAYQQLVDQGFLVARERRGHFVNPDVLTHSPEAEQLATPGRRDALDWGPRLRYSPSRQRNIVKPEDWLSYRYPFVYGQFDPSLFPIAEWRECCRMALGVLEVRSWASDRVDLDDPLLIEQIRARLLPKRGIFARPEEVMVTLGAQHALYSLAALLMDRETRVAMEEPGYPDARNIFARRKADIVAVPVDGEGLDPDAIPSASQYVFTTPSHHCPTTVSMPVERRRALLERAARDDFIVIEDDYDSQLLDPETPLPALKSFDEAGRVIYVGSMSKTLAPGLRLGYVVACPDLLKELRALRRLMLRHPPANNARAVALFLSLGHHDALLHRLSHAFGARRRRIADALRQHLPGWNARAAESGTAVWLAAPPGVDTAILAGRARGDGVLVEPGEVFFMREPAPTNMMRLGISSIALERIEPGIAALARAAATAEVAA